MRRLLPGLLVLASCTSSPCVTPPSAPSGALLSGAVTVPASWLDPSAGPDPVPVPRPVHLVYAPDRRQLPKLARFVEFVVTALGTA